MTYDAVSAYTVLFGDGGPDAGPATVSVHGSADEAWRALEALVAGPPPRRTARRRRAGRAPGTPADPARARAAAETWRLADPERRFWQVSSHRLQVTVPAIGAARVVARPD